MRADFTPPRRAKPSGLAALFRSPAGDFLEELHGEEVPQTVDARIIRGVTELLMELAQLSRPVAAELVKPTLVARIVDRGSDAGGAFGREEDVVVRRVLRRKLHDVSANSDARGSVTR